MKFRATLLGSLVAAGLSTGIALAQTAPARPAPNAALPLRLAYRTIGAAEARGAGGRYLDAARTHYRSALTRLGRNDNPGAAREAGASAALARAAIDERPLPVPRDLPTPPAMPTAAPRVMRGPMVRGLAMFGRFDPERLARDAALANTAEASDFAKNALEADVARERALFAGNREEGMRQRRLARDLSTAVRMLALADHPEAMPRPMRRPMNGPAGAVGLVPPPEIDEDEAAG